MDKAYPRASGCAGDPPGSLDVDFPHLVRIPPSAVNKCRGMDDTRRPVDGSLKRRFINDVARKPVHGKASESGRHDPALRSHECPYVSPACQKLADDVIADKASCPGDEARARNVERSGRDHSDSPLAPGAKRDAGPINPLREPSVHSNSDGGPHDFERAVD